MLLVWLYGVHAKPGNRGDQWPSGVVFAWLLVHLRFAGGVAAVVLEEIFQEEEIAVTGRDRIIYLPLHAIALYSSALVAQQVIPQSPLGTLAHCKL